MGGQTGFFYLGVVKIDVRSEMLKMKSIRKSKKKVERPLTVREQLGSLVIIIIILLFL